MLVGHIRKCWKCKYSGKFSFPGFFLGTALGLSVITSGLFALFVSILLQRGKLYSGGYLSRDPLVGSLLLFSFGFAGCWWMFKNRSKFFLCPNCHMPEAGGDPT
jgi:hypothetical protein